MDPVRLLRLGWTARLAIVTTVGSSASYATYASRKRLRSDSDAATAWPQTRTIFTQSRELTTERSEGHPASIIQDDANLSSKKAHSDDDEHSPGFEDHDTTAWASFSQKFATARYSFGSVKWSSIGDSIVDFVVPAWARQIPDYVQKLQKELSMAPGSLADEIWEEAHNVDINPEIMWDARVRVGDDLCREEKAFKQKRKEYVVKGLARYLNIKEEDIDPEDVPTIAMCGSGGGLRALVAGTASYLSSQEAGLFDCVTYTAGVSGSCWLQALYHSTLAGRNHEELVDHLKKRIGIHIAFPPPALQLMTTAPTNKFLLTGCVEKLKGDPKSDFGLVDVYGLLLAARLLVPKGELIVSDRDLKLSNQRKYVDSGAHPLPIYTAVRHEIPVALKEESQAASQNEKISQEIKDKVKREAWFQWFEFTPYEFFCEELSAGIPAWALGRPFKNGENVLLPEGVALPELRVPLMMGIWGSAFCATLSHYYKEIRPALKGLAGFGGIDSMIEERNDDLIKLHPINPATIPNYVLGMESKLPPTCPESLFKKDHIQLMDAGMSNNLPIYPLLRPGRDVDILIAFDASADIKRENWLSVVDGYARQRGIKGWPIGAGWPKESSKPEQDVAALDDAQASTSQEAATKLAKAREDQRSSDGNVTQDAVSKGKHSDPNDADLGYCTVWVGTAQERTSTTEPPPSKRLRADSADSDFTLMEPDAGIAVIYFPFLPNEAKVPGVDPDTSDFMSTWNFVYTPDQIDKVVQLARANFDEGKEQTKRTVRAVYERKKRQRLEREERSKD